MSLRQLEERLDELEYRLQKLENAEAEIAAQIEIPDCVSFTALEARIFSFLKHASPLSVKKTALYDAVYALRPEADEPNPKIIDIYIYKIRRKLDPFGIAIKTVWGLGYALPRQSLERWEALLEA